MASDESVRDVLLALTAERDRLGVEAFRWTSNARLTALTGLSRRSVQNALTRLRTEGLIVVSFDHGASPTRLRSIRLHDEAELVA